METRYCKRCEKHYPLTQEFYSVNSQGNWICRICRKENSRKNYARNKANYVESGRAWRERNRERVANYQKAYRKRYPEKVKEYQNLRNKRDAFKYRARKAARMEFLAGLIDKKPCAVCGDPKSEMHHPDYKKPFDIIWLCRKHHARLRRKT